MIPFCLASLLLAGCVTDSPEVVVDEGGSMEFLEPGLRPDVLFFPEYLLMEDFELHQHGRIPETQLVGAGMQTLFSLAEVRRKYGDLLAANGWKTDKLEMGGQSFLLKASDGGGDTLEIRAVQGAGPTHVFLLYHSVVVETQEPL